VPSTLWILPNISGSWSRYQRILKTV